MVSGTRTRLDWHPRSFYEGTRVYQHGATILKQPIQTRTGEGKKRKNRTYLQLETVHLDRHDGQHRQRFHQHLRSRTCQTTIGRIPAGALQIEPGHVAALHLSAFPDHPGQRAVTQSVSAGGTGLGCVCLVSGGTRQDTNCVDLGEVRGSRRGNRKTNIRQIVCTVQVKEMKFVAPVCISRERRMFVNFVWTDEREAAG